MVGGGAGRGGGLCDCVPPIKIPPQNEFCKGGGGRVLQRI